jgi:hypothetical protein
MDEQSLNGHDTRMVEDGDGSPPAIAGVDEEEEDAENAGQCCNANVETATAFVVVVAVVVTASSSSPLGCFFQALDGDDCRKATAYGQDEVVIWQWFCFQYRPTQKERERERGIMEEKGRRRRRH